MLFKEILRSADQRRSIRAKLLFVASTASLAVTGALTLQGPALAQGASDNSETVTVVGTRVNRQGYEAPTPTTVVGPATLEAQALINTADYVNNLPQMTPQAQNGSSTAVGTNRPNFRGLGPVRVLVLLDGSRMTYTDPQGGVDLNVMPTALIQSIEVVSGGASADWGSDAVAGVMNFHLNTTLQGIKGNFQCGESQYGDNQQCAAGFGAGTSFLNGKLHVVVAGEFSSSTGVMNAPDTSRKWEQHNAALLYNNAYAPGNGQYKYYVGSSCYANWTTAGVIPNGPLKGITFNPQGQPEPFVYGSNYNAANSPLFQDASGTCEKQYSMYVPGTVSPVHRQNGYTRFTYDITDTTSVYADALYAHNTAYNQAIPNYDAGNRVISIDNAFLPASMKALMVKNNVTTFNFGRWDPELAPNTGRGTSLFLSSNEVNRYVVGGKGAIIGSWTWDANFQYSRSEFNVHLYGSRNNAKWALGVDSVINPATGLPICRSTLTSPTNGCVPINVFGAGSISQNAVAYAGGTATAQSFYTGTIASANIQGEPFDLPAGPVSVAGGFETRTEHEKVKVDATSDAHQWRYGGLQSQSGAYTVNEGYLEAVVPILKGMSFADDLSVNVAGRITDYSTSGTVETWKVGVNYTPFESGVVRVRGTLSVDIRAPTLNELYSATSSNGQGILFDYAGNPSPDKTRHGVIARGDVGGNPNLIPETARTKVIGVVLTPDFLGLDGLTTSVDYYDINISQGILSLGGQTLLDQCGAGITGACAGITRDSTGTLVAVLSAYFNAQTLTREGVDFETSYVKDLEEWFPGTPGRLTVHALTAYTGVSSQSSGTTTINYVGSFGNGLPEWNGTVSAQYNVDAWQFYLQMTWVGGNIVDKTNTVVAYGGDPFYRADNHVPFYTNFSTTVSYDYSNSVTLFAGVDNLLNASYPYNIGENNTTTSGIGGVGYYDLIGRRYKVGFRFKL